MSHSYSSDISREQFARILPCLESARRTKPRTVETTFSAGLPVADAACGLPGLAQLQVFPAMEQRPDPAKYSILEQVLKKIGWHSPAKQSASFCIVDSQSVKNTDSAENKGYDSGKKVSGIKRHIAVDLRGWRFT